MRFFLQKLKKLGLNRIPGIRLLYDLLFFLYLKIVKPLPVINFKTFSIEVDLDDKFLSRRLLFLGSHCPQVTNLLERVINKGDIVLDVGANIGYFTLLMASVVGNKGMVYSFEPDKRAFLLLERNIKLNDFDHVFLYNKCVSNNNSVSTLYRNSKSAMSTMALKNIESPSDKVEVSNIMLDTFFNGQKWDKPAKLIKLNIQGAEPLAIAGSLNYLKANSTLLILEFWPDGMQNMGSDPIQFLMQLQDIGYRFFPVNYSNQYNSISISEALIFASKVEQYQKESFWLFCKKDEY